MDATTMAVDLAKDVFEVALANRAGRIIERKRLTRRQFERLMDTLTPATELVMEACGTAHYWGRRAQARGVHVRLLPPQYVRPYVRRNKTDRTDAEALLEAHSLWRHSTSTGQDGRAADAAGAPSGATPLAGRPHSPDQRNARSAT